jgi:hypothetical protein
MNIIQKISPHPSLPKRGRIPPFGKGRAGGILLMNAVFILRLLLRGAFNGEGRQK